MRNTHVRRAFDRTTTTPRPTRILGAAVVLAAVAACGGDGDGDLGPGDLDDLTAAEASLMVDAMLSAFTPSPQVSATGGGASVPMVTILADTSTNTQACQVSGTVTIMNQDSIRIVSDVRANPHVDTTFAVDATYGGTAQVVAQFQSCGSTDRQGGVWTFDANPGLGWDMTLAGDQQIVQLTTGGQSSSSALTWDAIWSGSFSWTDGSRSGTCPVSLQIASSTTSLNGQTTSSSSQSGTVCGLGVNRTFP